MALTLDLDNINDQPTAMIVILCTTGYSYPSEGASTEFISLNSDIQMKSLDLLHLIISELPTILSDSPRGFPQYLVDLMGRCKLQKTCLYHLQSLRMRTSVELQALGKKMETVVNNYLFFGSCLPH